MTVTATLVREKVIVPPEPEPDFAQAARILPRRIAEEEERVRNSSAGTTGVMPTLFSEALRLKQMRDLERRAAEVLVRLDIESFSAESVNVYAKVKLAEKLPENQQRQRKVRIVSTLGWLCGTMLVVSMLTILANNDGGFLTVTTAIVGFIGGITAMVIASGTDYWRWRWVEVERFSEEVPEYVLRKAIQVKQTLPEGKLYIYALSDRSIENPLFRNDPFLVLVAGESRFFLEVWDERAFEEQEHARRQEAERQELATAQK